MNRSPADRARHARRVLCHVAILTLLVFGAGPARVASAIALSAPLLNAAAAANEERSEYGVALAMQGEAARAESVFVSLLSNARGDARALNNRGNLRLLKGELGVALAFYDRALRGDSLDAGIHLNRATALLLMGDDTRARASAQTGIRLAGGLNQANALLGIRTDAEPAKAAEKSYINKNEIKAMLKSAAAAVPTETTRAPTSNPANAAGRAPTWRSAGPRASDQSDAASVLYWKR